MPFDLFRAPLPMVVSRVRLASQAFCAGFLRATANPHAAVHTMARALDAALRTGALAQRPEAEKAARHALGLAWKSK